MKKIVALLLTALLILSCFTGCRLGQVFEDVLQDYYSGLGIFQQVGSDKVDGSDNPLLQYTLNQEMIDLFYTLLEKSEKLAIAGEDEQGVEEITTQLDEAYTALVDQYQIAYIHYCLDQSDEELKNRYLDSTDIVMEAENAYNAMCKRVYLSETPLRDMLFEDWTQEDIDMLLAYNEEIAQLEKRNTELTVQFRDLSPETWEGDMIPLYNEMVRNNNRIAEIYGFANYYEYAYQVVYQRDYEMDQIYKMRDYTAQYLTQVCTASAEKFQQVYDSLDYEDSSALSELVYNSYDDLDKNYVKRYIGDMPESSEGMMNDMFDRDRAIFTNYENSYEGAFTTWIGGEPFCFFGNGYTDSETVIHELGHYYGSMYVMPWSQPMDLSETQSQGNEWMYTHFLESQLSSQLFEVMTEYKLMLDVSYIISFVMIDQFEEAVYTHEKAGNLTQEEYESIMDEVAEDYGGIDFVNENVLQIQSYWKQVVLESPVYYISYAVSGIAAVNLFTVAQEDEDRAEQIYCALMEEPVEDGGFLANIQAAGLTGPFEETVYQQLLYRYAI